MRDDGEAVAVFPVDFLLVEEGAIVYDGNITTSLDGVNNIRLRGYRVNVRNSDFVKRTDIHDNSAFLDAINFLLYHEAWVAEGCRFARPLEAVLLVKFIELSIDDVAISWSQWVYFGVGGFINVLPVVYERYFYLFRFWYLSDVIMVNPQAWIGVSDFSDTLACF